MSTSVPAPQLIDLTIADPLLLLNEIAKRYESAARILMEYVDNPLDDAEVIYRANGDRYPDEVVISIHIDTLRSEVTISDNCRGMTEETLRRIVQNIGQSQKRGLTWVNGRFGFGVHAFRAAAQRIRFRTKHAGHPCVELFFHKRQHTGIRPPTEAPSGLPSDHATGTVVTISDFDPIWFRELTADAVRQEIELHFEQLLARPNLLIEVRQDDGPAMRCRPFDYEAQPGESFYRALSVTHDGVSHPVEVNLKVCDRPVPDLRPRFFGRGRRINEVRAIKSFTSKSRHKTSVWGHAHLVGYIEVGEAIAPVITRDDFERTSARAALYEALLPIEDELKMALDAINQQQQDRRLNRLEDVLRSVLSKIAREDALNFRTELAGAGSDVPATVPGNLDIAPGSEGPPVDGPPPVDGTPTGTRNPAGTNRPHQPPKARTPKDDGNNPPTSPDDYPNPPNTATRRKSGFDIKFMELPADITGRMSRSRLLDGTIIINVGHDDFEARLDRSRQGQARVTERLINYLAGVVSIHYKDQYYEKYRNQPDRRDQLFDEQVDFVCRLEAALIPQIATLQAQMDADLTQGEGDGEEE